MKIKNILPMLMMLVAVTVAFAFTTPEKKNQKVLDEDAYFYRGGTNWDQTTPEDIDETSCPGSAVLCAIVFDLDDFTPSEAQQAALNNPLPATDGGFIVVNGKSIQVFKRTAQ